MIIHSIQAENVLKYERLDLHQLPDSGIIGIDGQNESGKSTLGETICFALFGRTYALAEWDIQKIIHWGSHRCSVKLEFSTGDERRYIISRQLDNEGNHGVRLYEKGREESPLAKGDDWVTHSLYALIGFNFEEFTESFYLAQREITTPEANSQVIKTMAGVAPLEDAMQMMSKSQDEHSAAIEAADRDSEQLQSEISTLNVDQEELGKLEAEQSKLMAEQAELQERNKSLKDGSDTYKKQLIVVQKARSARGFNRFLTFIFFVLAAAIGAAWGMIHYQPELSQTKQLLEMLAKVPQWKSEYQAYLPYAAGGHGAIFLLVLIRGISLAARIRTVRKKAAAILEHFPKEGGDSKVKMLRSLVEACDASGRQVEEWAKGEYEKQEKIIDGLKTRLDKLRGEISEERRRRDEESSLKARLDVLNAQRNEQIQKRAVAEESHQLLLGCTRQITTRFNTAVKTQVAETLPMFTENRYGHLQIDDDLQVRVFSSEKHDFMDLQETSNGTQRQIMLALRLALSQELINHSVKTLQFVMLDEPFAFFDEARTRQAMEILPRVSESQTQTFIIAQEFPDNTEFALRIHCQRDDSELVIEGGKPHIVTDVSSA